MSSFVWKHFWKESDGTVTKCKHCDEKLACKSCNMSAMRQHLEGKHSIVNAPKVTAKRDLEESDDEDAKPAMKGSASVPSSTSSSSPVVPLASFPVSPSRLSNDKIIQHLMEMIIDDMLPIATVQLSGFQNLLKYLAPAYTIPCRQ